MIEEKVGVAGLRGWRPVILVWEKIKRKRPTLCVVFLHHAVLTGASS